MTRDRQLKIVYKDIQFDSISNPLGKKKDKRKHSGGNGVVWELEIKHMPSNYVVKVLQGCPKEERIKYKWLERYQRFCREATTVASLGTKEELKRNHIVPILAMDLKSEEEYKNGEYVYFLMEKYEPISVGKNLNRNVLEITDILLQVLQGIKFLHSKGYAHRDIKLGNILKTSDGKYLLSDFGLIISDDLLDEGLTGKNEMVGPVGRPPELNKKNYTEEQTREIYQASDVYLFGKLCEQLLTNELRYIEGEFTPKSLFSFNLVKSLRDNVDASYLLEMMLNTVVQDYKRRWNLEQIERCLLMQKAACNSNNLEFLIKNTSLVLNTLDVHYNGYIISEKDSIQKILESTDKLLMTIISYSERNKVVRRISKVDGYYMIITDNKISIWFNPVRIEAKFNYSEILVILDNVEIAAPVFQPGFMENRKYKLTRNHKLELEFRQGNI